MARNSALIPVAHRRQQPSFLRASLILRQFFFFFSLYCLPCPVEKCASAIDSLSDCVACVCLLSFPFCSHDASLYADGLHCRLRSHSPRQVGPACHEVDAAGAGICPVTSNAAAPGSRRLGCCSVPLRPTLYGSTLAGNVNWATSTEKRT